MSLTLTLVNGFYHPLSSADHRRLTELGYMGTKIPEGSLSALTATLLKPEARSLTVRDWPSVITSLLSQWVNAVPYAEFRETLTERVLVRESGVKCRISTSDADGHVNIDAFTTKLGRLRHYLGRYSFLLITTFVNTPNFRVYTLRAEYSPDMQCIKFYSDIPAPTAVTQCMLSPTFRTSVTLESVANVPFISFLDEELTDGRWVPTKARSFQLSRVDRESLAALGAQLLAFGANNI